MRANPQAIKIAHALALTAQAIAREASKHYLAGGKEYEATSYAEFAGGLGVAPKAAWETRVWVRAYHEEYSKPFPASDPLVPIAQQAALAANAVLRAALQVPQKPSRVVSRDRRSPRRAKHAGGKTSSDIGLRYQR